MSMTFQSNAESLIVAIQNYFDLMYDCDVVRFGRVFAPTAQLHGFREGKMVRWTADEYREVLGKRQSPKSMNAPRGEQILLLDFSSPTQALVKVRVRIANAVFVDYLTYHLIDGHWLITSKGYHLEG
jgi:Putative lumazine-binding